MNIFRSCILACLVCFFVACETEAPPKSAPIRGPYSAGHNRTPWWADALLEAEDMDIALARKRSAAGDEQAEEYLRRNEKRHEWQKEHWNDPSPGER